MHLWGDKNVDWCGIEDAASFIGRRLRKRGRINVTTYKEKYGTVRVYCSLGWRMVHDIIYPGHVYSRFPNWLWRLDCRYGYLLLLPTSWLVLRFHRWYYRRVYSRALMKWPHLHDEIIYDAEFDELLIGL